MSQDSATSMKNTVRRFYDDLWNRFDVSVADEIISPDVVFRGTLHDSTHDLAGFKEYVREIQASFSDFYQRVDALYVDGDHCVARMFWTGTHDGDFRGLPATGRSFSYAGVAIFRFVDGLIAECWAVGDTHGLWSVITPSSGER